jgi:hypothetical protein
MARVKDMKTVDEDDGLNHLAGTWTDEEAAEFDAALAEQRRIEPELWEEQRADE